MSWKKYQEKMKYYERNEEGNFWAYNSRKKEERKSLENHEVAWKIIMLLFNSRDRAGK
jgi:hypothetical protein